MLKSKTILIKVLAFYFIVTVLFSCKKNSNDTKQDNVYSNSWADSVTSHGFGLINSQIDYSKIPTASAPDNAGTTTLQPSYLMEIPSVAFNQGNLGSCASCATATAKSILDHYTLNASYSSSGMVYSPTYLFGQIPNSCNLGTAIASNLDIVQKKGICFLTDLPYTDKSCPGPPNSSIDNLASLHKISSYSPIYPISTTAIKQYIQANVPVIVGFNVGDNFANNYWDPKNKDIVWSSFGTQIYNSNGSPASHATVLYGWDDTKQAFRMLNQWGTAWGDKGSIWVSYKMVENNSVFFVAYVLSNPTVVTNTNTLKTSGTLDFGTVGLNSTNNKTILLTNSGTGSISVSSVSIAAPFSVNWTGGVIAAGQTQSINVTYKPTIIGNSSQNLVINSNATNSNLTIAATGICNQQTTQTRVIGLSGNLSFGNINVGSYASQYLTISNAGNSFLNINSIILPYGFSGNYVGSVPPGGSQQISIFFLPTNTQSYNGSIIINSDATSGNNSIGINGVGISQSQNRTPISSPAINTYGNCYPSQANSYCKPFTDGELNARVISIVPGSHTIVFEVKKCNGTAFNSGGNLFVSSDLCSGTIYSNAQFQSGGTTLTITVTDNNMTGSKGYYLYTVQGSQSSILYDTPPITISY